MKKTNAQLVEENSQLERQIEGLRVIEEKDNRLLDEKDKTIQNMKKTEISLLHERQSLQVKIIDFRNEIKDLKINQAVEAMTFIKSALMLINYVNEPNVTHRVKSNHCTRATEIMIIQYKEAQKALHTIIDNDNLPF